MMKWILNSILSLSLLSTPLLATNSTQGQCVMDVNETDREWLYFSIITLGYVFVSSFAIGAIMPHLIAPGDGCSCSLQV